MKIGSDQPRSNLVVRATDGASVACWSIGQGSTTLLLVHGWGGAGSGRFWTPLLRHFDITDVRVIGVDLRGHGKSDQTHQGFTTEQFGEDLFAVADQAGAGRLVIAGYSMSAKWTQWMCSMRPDRVAGQILIGPAPALALPLPDEMLSDWLTAARDRSRFEPWLRQFTKAPLTPEIVDAYYEDVFTTPEHSLKETFNMCRTGEFTGSLSATCAPTLALCGIHDPVLTPDLVRQEVVARIPGARMALLDCGHEIPLEKPLETAAIIQAFLAGLR